MEAGTGLQCRRGDAPSSPSVSAALQAMPLVLRMQLWRERDDGCGYRMRTDRHVTQPSSFSNSLMSTVTTW